MKIVITFALAFASFLYSNNDPFQKSNIIYLITRFTPEELNDKLFELPNFGYLKKLKDRLFKEHNLILKTPKTYDSDMSAAKYIILVNGAHKREYLTKYRKDQLILASYEPPCINPALHDPNYFSFFGKILTWRDDLVDNKTRFKLWMPRGNRTMIDNIPAFEKKKLCALIATFRPSGRTDAELMSERVKITDFFESTAPGLFDLYGKGWDQKKYKNYKGSIGSWNNRSSKIECIKNYKFYICYENCYVPGYVSEKIFDCFQAACVPIYLGATNIEEHIPNKCYIDRRDFKNDHELFDYINQMTEKEYNTYLLNIKKYLESEAAKLYSAENFVDSVIRCIIVN